MFRLISSNGREYLLQAASEGELQLWSASIAAAIRESESKERVYKIYDIHSTPCLLNMF